MPPERIRRLTNIEEYDWNPSVYPTAEETINPIISLAKEFLEEGCAYSSIGISFPDVVIRDRILGGETPKTKGLRESAGDYEHEFAKITALNEKLEQLCTKDGNIRIINDSEKLYSHDGASIEDFTTGSSNTADYISVFDFKDNFTTIEKINFESTAQGQSYKIYD